MNIKALTIVGGALMFAAYNWWGARGTAASPIDAALNLPQSNPTETLEYAPVPPDSNAKPNENGNESALGLGSSSGIKGSGASGAGAGGGQGAANSFKGGGKTPTQWPRTKSVRCGSFRSTKSSAFTFLTGAPPISFIQ